MKMQNHKFTQLFCDMRKIFLYIASFINIILKAGLRGLSLYPQSFNSALEFVPDYDD